MKNGKPNKTSKSTLQRAKPQIVRGSGNVFADLGLPNPEIAQAKAELVRRIRRILDSRQLTQIEASRVMGIDQPKISSLVRGRVDGFSLERLFLLLSRLGQSVEIRIRPTKNVAVEMGIHVVPV